MSRPFLLALAVLALATTARAEIHFLAKQYTRCSSCHYSESGGTLLTPYGRSLSREELSTFGQSGPDSDGTGVHEALFGLVREAFGGLEGFDLGVALRPSTLEVDFGRLKIERDLWMKADVQAAFRRGSWTAYAELGRFPAEPAEFISREHWLGWRSEEGFGVKVGRFLPAFGLRHLDHTAYHRRDLGFDNDDQIYGVEFSDAGDSHLVQFSLGPGFAESTFDDDDGRRGFTATGRVQLDLSNRQTLIFSGLFRDHTKAFDRHAIGSVAYGIAPHERLAIWTELDTRVAEDWKGTPEYTVFNEVSFEVYRGIWLKYSPQLKTEVANVSGGFWRQSFGVQLFPYSHFNLNLTWARDKDRVSGNKADTFVLQFHIYL